VLADRGELVRGQRRRAVAWSTTCRCPPARAPDASLMSSLAPTNSTSGWASRDARSVSARHIRPSCRRAEPGDPGCCCDRSSPYLRSRASVGRAEPSRRMLKMLSMFSGCPHRSSPAAAGVPSRRPASSSGRRLDDEEQLRRLRIRDGQHHAVLSAVVLRSECLRIRHRGCA